jgi:hypothetical protein
VAGICGACYYKVSALATMSGLAMMGCDEQRRGALVAEDGQPVQAEAPGIQANGSTVVVPNC